jgi:hypothetical protein
MKATTYILLLLLPFLPVKLAAQGCSDAGICTAPGQTDVAADGAADTLRRNMLGVTASWGLGEQAVSVFQVIPEAEFFLGANIRFQVKVPYSYATGNLGKAQGIGDITAGFSWTKSIRKNALLRFSVLTKLPAGKTNRGSYLLPLPMPYQPGLGTTDLIGAVAFNYKTWSFSGAYQHVLRHANNNMFLHNAWPLNEDAMLYFESARLKRGNDVLLRAAKNFTRNRFTITPGMLLLYRLQEDEVNGAAVKGADGITVNATARFMYRMPGNSSFALLAGSPLVVRDVRPDGLTRALVINITYIYPFHLKQQQP